MPEKLIFDPVTGELVARQSDAGPARNAARVRHAEPHRPGGRPVASLAGDLRSPDPGVVRRALGKMAAGAGEEWDGGTLAALVELLARDEDVAGAAIEIAAREGFHAAAAPILRQHLRAVEVGLQCRALELLRRLGPQAAVLADEVAPLLESPVEAVGAAACEALASMGLTAGALQEVASMIRHKEPAPRLRCVRLLGLLGARAAKAAGLVVLRMDDPLEEVRAAARAALLQIGFQAAAMEEVGRMLNHSRLERRLEMLALLRGYGSSAVAASPLIVALLRSESVETREAAAHTLKVTGMDASCLRAIQQLAAHPAHGMRAMAMDLLEECDMGGEAVGLLLSLMADRDVEVRARAAHALAQRDLQPPHLPALRKLLRDERWEVRLSTINMLETAGQRSRPALRLIVERLEDGNADVARAAAAAVREIGIAPFCLPDVERLLSHRSQDKRLLMLGVLQRLGPGAGPALPLVTRGLGDQDWVVREAACEAFISIGFNDSCLPEVRRLIQHQDREFRLAVIKALGACGLSARAAADFLHARQQDSDAEVGRAARQALRDVQA